MIDTFIERHYKNILLFVLLAAFLSRAVASIYLGEQFSNLPGTFDQVSYDALAIRLLDGHGFTYEYDWWPATPANQPTAHWSYLYTYFIAGVYGLFGHLPVLARLIQSLIVSILHPYLAYLIGYKVFNRTVGILAAALSAGYFYFIYYTANLMTESFYITAILASLYLAITLVERNQKTINLGLYANDYALALGLGLVLGIAVLLRQLYLLIIPLIYLWMLWSGGRASRAYLTKALILVTAIVILMILPFTIYNYLRFDRFVLLNTNAGFAFFWGNHPIYGTKFIPILPRAMGSYQDLIPTELLKLDEAALDQALLKRGLEFVIQDPVRYLLLSISRIPPYFMFWPSSDSRLLSNLARVASFGLYLPFMVAGIIITLRRLRKDLAEFLASPVALLLGFALIYTGIHILSWALIRYRLPVDGVLIVFAGAALRALLNWASEKRSSLHSPRLEARP